MTCKRPKYLYWISYPSPQYRTNQVAQNFLSMVLVLADLALVTRVSASDLLPSLSFLSEVVELLVK